MPEGLYHPIHTDEPFTLGILIFILLRFHMMRTNRRDTGWMRSKISAVATDLGKYDSYTVKNLQNLDAVLLGGKS